MPIFDFICGDCEELFEKLVRSSNERPECPRCGSMDTHKKQVQSINFELKGVGVYKNNTQ
jgi:putative FmdB family regulatory protein